MKPPPFVVGRLRHSEPLLRAYLAFAHYMTDIGTVGYRCYVFRRVLVARYGLDVRTEEQSYRDTHRSDYT